MDLVLADIAKWHAQLKGELAKIEEALSTFDERVKEERTRLEATKKVAEQKIEETEELLEAHEYSTVSVEEVVAEEAEAVEEVEVPAKAAG